MSPREVIPMILFLAMFATIGWLFHMAVEMMKRQRRMKAQAEMHGRLLDKFGSAHEVVEFLQTPGGAQFMESVSGDREDTAGGILRFTQRGIVLVMVGLGCLALYWFYRSQENPLLVIGLILLCLGIGFLLSAAVSRRLAKSLGLVERTGRSQN